MPFELLLRHILIDGLLAETPQIHGDWLVSASLKDIVFVHFDCGLTFIYILSVISKSNQIYY